MPQELDVIELSDYQLPYKFISDELVRTLLLKILKIGVSDIYIQPGYPICVRKDGVMKAVTKSVTDSSELDVFLDLVTKRKSASTNIVSGNSINVRFDLRDPVNKDQNGENILYGFRVNASPIRFDNSISAQIVMRFIPSDPIDYKKLGVKEELISKVTPERGIVYIAGPTGSGKTTTFSSFVKYILENDTPIKGNIITHEDPIEYVYGNIKSKHSIVVQSEIPTHFKTYQDANREAMRRKPALILIGELRDLSTIKAAVEASMTGHPVYATVHANNVAGVVRRLVTRLPPEEASAVSFDIIETAQCIIAQDLVPKIGGGLVAIREYLTFTPEIRERLYVKSGHSALTSEITKIVEEFGHSFLKEAITLYKEEVIDYKTANKIAITNGIFNFQEYI